MFTVRPNERLLVDVYQCLLDGFTAVSEDYNIIGPERSASLNPDLTRQSVDVSF